MICPWWAMSGPPIAAGVGGGWLVVLREEKQSGGWQEKYPCFVLSTSFGF